MAGAIVPQRTFHRAPPIPVWLGLQIGRVRTDRPNAKPIIAEPGKLRSIRAPAAIRPKRAHGSEFHRGESNSIHADSSRLGRIRF